MKILKGIGVLAVLSMMVSMPALASRFNSSEACQAIYEDAVNKMASKVVEQGAVLREDIPQSLWRTAFNELAKPEVDSVEVNGLTWERATDTSIDESSVEEACEAFAKELPYKRCVLSNTTKPLYVTDVSCEGNDAIVTYAYTGSIFAGRDTFQIKVKTRLPRYVELNRQMDNLARRAAKLVEVQHFDLSPDCFEHLEGAEVGSPQARALDIVRRGQEKLAVAMGLVEAFYDGRNVSELAHKKYTALAWNAYQLRDIIQDNVITFLEQTRAGKRVERLNEKLDEFERNLNLHFDINIALFARWAQGNDMPEFYNGIFSDSLES